MGQRQRGRGSKDKLELKETSGFNARACLDSKIRTIEHRWVSGVNLTNEAACVLSGTGAGVKSRKGGVRDGEQDEQERQGCAGACGATADGRACACDV